MNEPGTTLANESIIQSTDKLLQLIPPCRTDVEHSGSGLSLLFQKAASGIEVINDADSGIFSLFRVLHNPKLLDRFYQLLSIKSCNGNADQPCNAAGIREEDDVVRVAVRWFLRISPSLMGRTSASSMSGADHLISLPETLSMIVSRLKSVQIEHLSFGHLVKSYDDPETLFFLESPCPKQVRKTKYITASPIDDVDLVYTLLRIKGKVIFLGHANPMFDYLDRAGWEHHDFPLESVSELHAESRIIWIRK
jgi:DNA adenine methylase